MILPVALYLVICALTEISCQRPSCSLLHRTGPVGAVIGGTLAIAATATTAHRAAQQRMSLNISSISMWSTQSFHLWLQNVKWINKLKRSMFHQTDSFSTTSFVFKTSVILSKRSVSQTNWGLMRASLANMVWPSLPSMWWIPRVPPGECWDATTNLTVSDGRCTARACEKPFQERKKDAFFVAPKPPSESLHKKKKNFYKGHVQKTRPPPEDPTSNGGVFFFGGFGFECSLWIMFAGLF